MQYDAFPAQSLFHSRRLRRRAAISGKRGGKTECGALESIIFSDGQIGFKDNGIDPYLGVIIAPTTDMLRRLAVKKITAYANDLIIDHHMTHQEITWHNGSVIYGISADKPQRLEGVKANWIWIDEAFQVSEQLFLEAMARVSDTQGYLWVTSSLGIQYANPKRHWVYKYFKEKPLEDSAIIEWPTAANPHYPKSELESMRNQLDPRTYRQMFEVDWSVPGTAMVYNDWDDANVIKNFILDPMRHEVSISIDWGWAHEMAVLFIAYDVVSKTITVFDEIVRSKMTLQDLYARIKAKNYPVRYWFSDVAGNQEREQTGKSNIAWFAGAGRNIQIRSRRMMVIPGISMVRSWVMTGSGERRLFVDETRCPKTLDGILNYSYAEKDGEIMNENPIKKNDDVNDALRYYIVNRHDENYNKETLKTFDRWGTWKF